MHCRWCPNIYLTLKRKTTILCLLFLILQLFSKSTADGLELYQPHVDSLKDSNPTIAFTRKMNDLFDLLNSRVPKDGVWMHSKRNKLKVRIEAFCFVTTSINQSMFVYLVLKVVTDAMLISRIYLWKVAEVHPYYGV